MFEKGLTMKYDGIVIGGGIAGLTAAAFLTKEGISTLLIEKEPHCGGLINSFNRDGFVYDGGIRATENAGILFPMLKQLNLDIEFVNNKITIGLEDRIIRIESTDDTQAYQDLLTHFYPESKSEIDRIMRQIKKIMHYMDVQYSIDNPAFLDFKEDREYMLKEILPWMVKYAFTAPKIAALNDPVVEFLRKYTQNQSLLDNITQHFFTETPAFFALSYLKLYLEYHYPVGGTGKIIEKMVGFIQNHNGVIQNNTRITAIQPNKRQIFDDQGNVYQYRQLIWAADITSFYEFIDLEDIPNEKHCEAIKKTRQKLNNYIGNDSVLTLFMAVDLDKSYFAKIASEHFFYTPSRKGISFAGPIPIGKNRKAIEEWLQNFFALTTYEISIPALRDSSLAPDGKTGLIISALFDYHLTRYIQDEGWYDDFKQLCEQFIIENLTKSVYPEIKDSIIHQFSSTPLTMEQYTANRHGAITGWSFTNHPLPAENRLTKIFSASQTPFKDIYQAGQWSYSPAGLPISILTGKLASDKVIKILK